MLELAVFVKLWTCNIDILDDIRKTFFIDRARLLTKKLLNQGYVVPKLQSSLLKFYGRHHDLVDRYDKTVS